MSAREPGVHVQFEMLPVLHGIESAAHGREIYVDEPHVRVRVAGMDKDEWVSPVNEQIKARFPEEWEQFQKGMEAPKIGTPLHAWGQMTPARIKNLEGFNVFTVEDIAVLPETAIQKIGMGARKLQEDARKFLSLSQTSADVKKLEELEAANKAKDAQLAEQAAAIAALQAQMADLVKPKGKKKVVEEAPE